MPSKSRFTVLVSLVSAVLWLTVEALPRDGQPADAPRMMNAGASDCSYYPGHEQFYLANPTKEREEISLRLRHVSSSLPQVGSFYAPAPKNYIDNWIFDKMARDSVSSANLSSDAEFLRRIYLDATGRIPTQEVLTGFLSDASGDKREKLIDSLLGTAEYADRWANFFGDLIQVVIVSTQINLFPEARNAFHNFVRTSIAQNKPYDQFARELINGSGENRTNGAANYFVRWRQQNAGRVLQDTYDNLAVAVGKDFLGMSLDCISCHDGAGHTNTINLYLTDQSRYDLWELAAFFSKTAMVNPVRVENQIVGYTVQDQNNAQFPGYVLNTTTGNKTPRVGSTPNEVVAPKYLADGSASADKGPNAGESNRAALARMVTSDRQFARATVNYLWKELFGLGIVEPAENFDLKRIAAKTVLEEGWTMQATHPELLEALAADFEAHKYDLRYMIGTIMKSATYQLSSSYSGTWSDASIPYFARKFPRRLKGEEIHDIIVQATSVPPNPPYQVSTAFVPQGGQGTFVTYNWIMQMPDPTEPRATIRGFLDAFIRGNRDDRPRSAEGSISQALALLNNTFVTSRVKTSNAASTVGKLFANKSLSPADAVNQLYLTTLSRYPTSTELSTGTAYLGSQITSSKLEDLQFALLNKVDFIFNY